MESMRYIRSLFPDNFSMQKSNQKFVLILLAALAVRLVGIASRPIWYDEAFSILFSEKGLSAMLYGTLAPTGAGSADIHPPGYYTMLWLWMRAFGESLVAVRALSIVAGLITTWLVYLIAYELFDSTTALWSMLFSALSPFQVHYAQEIRMYSFLAMWLMLATLAFFRGARTRQWRWWILFSIASALAQYTHNLAAFFLIALALIPLFQKNWKTLRSVVLASFLAVVFCSPWLMQLPAQFAKVQQGYWVERPDASRLFTLLIVYVTNTPLPDAWIMIALLIVLVAVAIGILQTVRAHRRDNTSNGVWIFYLSFAPPMLLFLFSQWKPVYIERALLPSGAMFCIWLAWVITRTNLSNAVRIFLLGILTLASMMGIYEHATYRDFPYGPFQELDVSLKERIEQGDVIVHSNKLTMLPAILFDRDLPQSFIADLPGSDADTLAPATQEVLKIKATEDIQVATADAGRVWYVMFQRAIDELGATGQATHPDLEYLNSRYRLVSQEEWDGLQVYLYARQP